MAVSEARKQRTSRRRWPLAEKRRIVELTLRSGASTRAIAIELGVNRNSLCRWRALYRAGKLDAQAAPGDDASTGRPTFLPVRITPAVGKARPVSIGDAVVHGGTVVRLELTSGARMQIETMALDSGLLCALIAELRR